MEDELCIYADPLSQWTYAAVFDGHGGEEAAQWLRRELHTRLVPAVTSQLPTAAEDTAEAVPDASGLIRPQRTAQLLTQAFEQADADLLRHLEARAGAVTGASGATATVALLAPGRAVVASLGDSAAVLCRRGEAVLLSAPHRVYGLGEDVLEETARVEATGGWVHDGRVCSILAVSRAFGDWEFKGAGLQVLLSEGAAKGIWTPEFAASQQFSSDPVIATPDVVEVVLTPDDEFLVIASDGLWDYMPHSEVVRFARQQFKARRNVDQVAYALADIALKRYTTDNVAVVVVDLKGGPEAWSASKKHSGSGSGGGGGFLGSLFKRG